jgi:hypothetical protein
MLSTAILSQRIFWCSRMTRTLLFQELRILGTLLRLWIETRFFCRSLYPWQPLNTTTEVSRFVMPKSATSILSAWSVYGSCFKTSFRRLFLPSWESMTDLTLPAANTGRELQLRSYKMRKSYWPLVKMQSLQRWGLILNKKRSWSSSSIQLLFAIPTCDATTSGCWKCSCGKSGEYPIVVVL